MLIKKPLYYLFIHVIFSDGTKDDYDDSGVNIKLENSQSDNENEGTSSKWPVFGMFYLFLWNNLCDKYFINMFYPFI